MNKKLSLRERVYWYIVEDPSLLPLLAEQTDKRMVKRYFDQYMSQKVGIEFEVNSIDYSDAQYMIRNYPTGKKGKLSDLYYDSGQMELNLCFGGMVQLAEFKRFCENELVEHFALNHNSGLHYHIEMPYIMGNNYDDGFIYQQNISNQQNISKYVLTELDSWEYQGGYNERSFGRGRAWCRVREQATTNHSTHVLNNSTFEIRIGEMSFDYSRIIQRILHAQRIVKHVEKMYIANMKNRRFRYERRTLRTSDFMRLQCAPRNSSTGYCLWNLKSRYHRRYDDR